MDALRMPLDRPPILTNAPTIPHGRQAKNSFERADGQTFVLPIPDAFDGQIGAQDELDVLTRLDFSRLQPLVGPIPVDGAHVGNVLDIEIQHISVADYGLSVHWPDSGCLHDVIAQPFLAHWEVRGSYAVSAEIPGFEVPGAPFITFLQAARSFESAKIAEFDSMGMGTERLLTAHRPAHPKAEPVATRAFRRAATRRTGGDISIGLLGPGSRLLLPVEVPGALLSVGGIQYAGGHEGLGGWGIQIAGEVELEVHVLSNRSVDGPIAISAQSLPLRNPSCVVIRGFAERCEDNGGSDSVGLATRNALLRMIELLTDVGYNAEQALVICNVSVSLSIDSYLDHSRTVVSASLPLDHFSDPHVRNLLGVAQGIDKWTY